jgi:hypothetical protein
MNVARGHDVDQEQANEWVWNLARRLPEHERPTCLTGTHPHLSYDLYVVTSERVLMVSARRGYEIVDEFPLTNVKNVYTGEDRNDRIVHVPMKDDDHYVLRPRQTGEDADLLARAIYAAAASKNPESSRNPIMPQDDGSSGPTLLEEAGLDYLMLVVPRDEVEAGDIEPVLSILATLITSRRTVRAFMERVSIAFDGYNDTTAELFEIEDVRAYVRLLDGRFPYWLYFLDKRTNSFDAMWRCYMPPDLTPAAQAREYPARLEPLLRNWWGPRDGRHLRVRRHKRTGSLRPVRQVQPLLPGRTRLLTAAEHTPAQVADLSKRWMACSFTRPGRCRDEAGAPALRRHLRDRGPRRNRRAQAKPVANRDQATSAEAASLHHRLPRLRAGQAARVASRSVPQGPQAAAAALHPSRPEGCPRLEPAAEGQSRSRAPRQVPMQEDFISKEDTEAPVDEREGRGSSRCRIHRSVPASPRARPAQDKPDPQEAVAVPRSVAGAFATPSGVTRVGRGRSTSDGVQVESGTATRPAPHATPDNLPAHRTVGPAPYRPGDGRRASVRRSR